LRALAQDGPLPDVARLSDEDETRISLTLSGPQGAQRRAMNTYLRLRRARTGCLLITGFEGDAADVHYRRKAVRRRLSAAGAVSLGERAGQAWERGRLSGPYLRDTLLDAGVLAETLETATTWSNLARLDEAVRAALHEALDPALVGCHVSHVYPTGASLYFTVLAAARPGEEIAQWERAKRAANDAIVAVGGTITHHHGVGTAHREHVGAELGDLGVEILRAVKQVVDPRGVLNPGKLLPPR
jgi:alkyldihydroxyacetonephosphate synthase